MPYTYIIYIYAMKPISLLPLLSLLPATLSAQQSGERPNVILLVADDLGYGDLSCYGAAAGLTPHTDSIARHGLRFTDAHACASTSTPSRYALLTGEYPFRRRGTDVAAGDAALIIKPEQFTLADLFKNNGYTTAAIGKWHLGIGSAGGRQNWNDTIDKDLSHLGFDYHYIMAATADRVPCVYIENGRVAHYDASAPIAVSYRQPFEGEPTARTHPELLTKLRSSHGHDQAIVNGIGRIGYMKGGGSALWQDETIADSIVHHAIEFMERQGDHPFFLYLCTNDIHVPRYPHERFRGKSGMGLRGDAILQFDWTVGRIAEALRHLGIADNTLLIITSDNGPVLDDGYADEAEERIGGHRPAAHWRGGKYSAFEAGSAVPFIVNWPGKLPYNGTSNALLSHIDAIASLAALLRAPLPDGAAPDSRPQLATWLGRSTAPCPYAVKMASNRSLALRTAQWKFIEPSQGAPIVPWGPKIETGYLNEPQLYNIKTDSAERFNVAAQHPDTVARLKNLLNLIKVSP